ncbi:MAG TPA: DUF1801 domain-containing protein, partial [Paludibacter sp.]|nr:DUF1801 domain-containing protein [Paludibacter sp.]
MSKIKFTDNELVTQHIENLPKDIQPAVEYLRQVILSIDNEIAEHIKWNSPAFYFSGEMKAFDPKEYKRDILVMNLRKDKIMCVLPTGMTIKKNIEILEGNYPDGRRMINFTSLDDIKTKENKLKK